MGLVAQVIEESGIPTAVLSWIPEIPVAVGSPRVVGIGYPGSVPFGPPGDASGQRSVLEGALEAAAGIEQPGERVDLDFEWPVGTRVPKPPVPPPIARAVKRRPWLYWKLLNGDIP